PLSPRAPLFSAAPHAHPNLARRAPGSPGSSRLTNLSTSIGWTIGVRCARRDRGLLLEAGLEIIHDPHHRAIHPAAGGGDAMTLARVLNQVEQARIGQLPCLVVLVLLPDEVQLPMPPFDRIELVADVAGETLPVRLLLFAQEEIGLIHPIDPAVL